MEYRFPSDVIRGVNATVWTANSKKNMWTEVMLFLRVSSDSKMITAISYTKGSIL